MHAEGGKLSETGVRFPYDDRTFMVPRVFYQYPEGNGLLLCTELNLKYRSNLLTLGDLLN